MFSHSTLRIVMGIGLIAVVSACSPNPNAPTRPPVAVVTPPTFTLSGTVVESTASGPRPVAFTEVWISSVFRGTTSLEGKYSIPGLPAGTYSVRFTSLYHEITTRNVQIGGDTTFDVELAPLESFTLSARYEAGHSTRPAVTVIGASL